MNNSKSSQKPSSCDQCRRYGGGRLPYLANSYRDLIGKLTDCKYQLQDVVTPRWGPCPYCTDFKWAVLGKDDVLTHVDNAAEAENIKLATGGIIVRQANSEEVST